MPAGSGPQVASSAGVAVSNAEVLLCAVGPAQWNNPDGSGTLVSFSIYFTDSAAGNLTVRIRQGLGTGGTVVGPVSVTAFTLGQQLWVSGQVNDTSAFGNSSGGPGGIYSLTAVGSVAAMGTATYALCELETVAAVI